MNCHPKNAEIYQRALNLRAQGRSLEEIARLIGMSRSRTEHWLQGIPPGRQIKAKGSGVIAGRPYATGYNWEGGW